MRADAFNLVMATGIVSVALQDDRVPILSTALMWVAIAALGVITAIDVPFARHPVALLRRAGRLDQGFHALGLVAAICVIGSRVVGTGAFGRTASAVLLVLAVLFWLAIVVAIAVRRAGARVDRARGEWLLAVVATEGLAILALLLGRDDRAQPLHTLGLLLWGVGGLAYLLIAATLALRVLRRPLAPADLTPDWWIVMGAPAIFTVAAASTGDARPGSAVGVLGLTAWLLATVGLPCLIAAELWRWRRIGRPAFGPERWTMVFPLGMYSVASQSLGHALGAGWMVTVGDIWLFVALAAWLAVAGGELRQTAAVYRP
jgi:tellurite resistance protein TehA-like permease